MRYIERQIVYVTFRMGKLFITHTNSNNVFGSKFITMAMSEDALVSILNPRNVFVYKYYKGMRNLFVVFIICSSTIYYLERLKRVFGFRFQIIARMT